MENKRFFTYTAIAACMICAIAVAFNVFTDFELPGRIMAAILGVVITATITQVLLQGQTQKEGTLKRDSKIFEEKLKIYQNFLNSLYKAVKDGKLTDSEKMELQFQTSLVAMHCDPKFIKTISDAVNGVIKSTCPNKGDEHTPQTALIASLFDVVEAFRQDLYPDEFEKFDKEDRDYAIKKFDDAYQNANEGEDSPKEHLVVDVNLLSNISTLITQATTQNSPELADDNNPKANSIEKESTDNLYDEKGIGEQPVPIATTIFNGYPKLIQENNIEIVPVVFITVEALRLNKPMTNKILNRIDAMCKANDIKYQEIQLDCDWTNETKSLFYSLCKEAKQKLHKRRKGLSATIRLHQLRYELPDIDYGVLMLYNTESLYNPNVKNSILSSKVVGEYMKHAKSKVHLDFAYPAYEWNLWFKEGKFMGIVTGAKPSIGRIRHEQSEFNEIIKTKRVIKKDLKDIGYSSSTIIYHLDSANLSKYTDYEIDKIYSR